MKITKLTFSATIPTGQYANITPSIEISEIEDIKSAEKAGIDFIKGFYARFSTIGELNDRVKVSNSSGMSEINKIGL